MSLDDPAAGERVVKRFYEEHWNRWRFDLADDILAHDVTFRASLGTTVTGRE